MSANERVLAVNTTNFEQVYDALSARNVQPMSVDEYNLDCNPIESRLRNSAVGPYNDIRAYCYVTRKNWIALLLTRWNINCAYGGDAASFKLSEISDVINLGEGDYVTEAKGYRSSKIIWSIMHDSERGPKHLETSGELPDCFDSIRDKELQKGKTQPSDSSFNLFGFASKSSNRGTRVEKIHMSSVPINVVEDITGHKHGYGLDTETVYRIEFD